MKNLLIITSSNFPYGSASANLLRLMGVGLTQLDWNVEVFLQRGLFSNNPADAPPRSGTEQGVFFKFCGFRHRPRNVLLKLIDSLMGNLSALMGILRRKINGKDDVVLVYNSSGLENAIILLWCKILRVTAVAYLSEWYEKKSVVRRWYHILRWWDFLFRMKFVAPRYDGLMMPSHFLLNYYKDKSRISKSRLYILPNLVDISCFEDAEVDQTAPKEGVRIGYCGTPTRKDGAEDLLRAFQLVLRKQPSAELIIAGDSLANTQLLPNLKHLAMELGVYEKVTFTGLLPFSRMPGLLLSCDILALARPAGIFAEAGFPTKLGEYMACKKPVVLTRVGDLPHYLSHKKNAMLAESDNPVDFAKQILWLIDHPDEANAIAALGYSWAVKSLSHKEASTPLSNFFMSLK